MQPGPIVDDDELPHLQALEAAMRAGFRYRHLRAQHAGELAALYAERRRPTGVIEHLTVRSMTEAIAVRVRCEDYPNGHPLWQRVGPVADVVRELLELPEHGSAGAPTITRHADSLWAPPFGGRMGFGTSSMW